MSYLLCGTPRTGSTFLCSLLASTGVLGRPESWFREPDEAAWCERLGVPVTGEQARDFAAYVRAVRRRAATPNGIGAARVMWGSLERLVDELGESGESALRPRSVTRRCRWGLVEYVAC